MAARLGRCAVTRRQWLLVAGLALFALLSVAVVSAWNAVALQITTINPRPAPIPRCRP